MRVPEGNGAGSGSVVGYSSASQRTLGARVCVLTSAGKDGAVRVFSRQKESKRAQKKHTHTPSLTRTDRQVGRQAGAHPHNT